MRHQSGKEAERTAAVLLTTLSSDNGRESNHSTGYLHLLRPEEVLQGDDGGVLATVDAMKIQQSLKEREEKAGRKLAKRFRPNEEIDQFADDVIPSPTAPPRRTGKKEWDR